MDTKGAGEEKSGAVTGKAIFSIERLGAREGLSGSMLVGMFALAGRHGGLGTREGFTGSFRGSGVVMTTGR